MKRRQLKKDNKGMKGAIEAIIALFVILFLVLVLVNVSNILYTSEIPAQAQDQVTILFAVDYAESGTGTNTDPWIDGLKNAYANLSSKGGMVIIDSGFHVCKTKTSVNKTISIIGVGRSSVLKRADSLNDHVIEIIDPSLMCTLKDFEIDGNKNTLGKNGIYIETKPAPILDTKIIIMNLYIHDCKQYGIEVETSNQVYISNCNIWNCTEGIHSHMFFDGNIYNNHIESCDEYGMNMHTLYDSMIIGNEIEACDGGMLLTGCVDNHISDNMFERCGSVANARYAVSFDGGSRNTFTNNLISEGHYIALFMYSSYQNTLIGNVIDDIVNHGMYIRGSSSNNVINANVIRHCGTGATGKAGIHMEMTANNNTIIGNRCYDDEGTPTQYYGITLGGSVDYITVSDNILTENVVKGLYIIGSINQNGIVHDNTGYISEKYSSSTILNGNTHVIVTHGMDVTPTSITLTGNHSEVSSCWVVNITSTQFEIWISSAVTSDRTVYWYAEARNN